MPSLEIYHEELSPQELKVWNHSIMDAQQFSEDHMDELLSERALEKGLPRLPPTNLSYAEFVGMRVKTLSFLSFKNEQKEYNIFLPGKTPEVLLGTERDRGSDSDDEGITVKGKGRGKGRGSDKAKGKGKGKGKFNLTQVPVEDIDPTKLIWTPLPREEPAKGSGRTNYRALRPETFYNWLHTVETNRSWVS